MFSFWRTRACRFWLSGAPGACLGETAREPIQGENWFISGAAGGGAPSLTGCPLSVSQHPSARICPGERSEETQPCLPVPGGQLCASPTPGQAAGRQPCLAGSALGCVQGRGAFPLTVTLPGNIDRMSHCHTGCCNLLGAGGRPHRRDQEPGHPTSQQQEPSLGGDNRALCLSHKDLLFVTTLVPRGEGGREGGERSQWHSETG